MDDNLFVVAQQKGNTQYCLRKSPLAAVVPKPSEQRSSATMGTKAKEVLISQTCNNAYKGKKGSTDLSDLSLNRWLYDTAIQQGVNRVSCKVTVIVVVTDIGVSSTVTSTRNDDIMRATNVMIDGKCALVHLRCWRGLQFRSS